MLVLLLLLLSVERGTGLAVPRLTTTRRLAPRMEAQKANFCVVGCGSYGRGMGWFHGLQLQRGECEGARLQAVVEPWFLGKGADSDAGRAFAEEVVAEWQDVHFASELSPAVWGDDNVEGPRIALIAGRTADNPALFRAALESGATHVMLEKPGAPTVKELEAMASEAEAAGVPVFMGFIKQISAYVASALKDAEDDGEKKKTVAFRSYNDYSEDGLGECFKRNAEGMLKNMAIHELALAVDFFGMTVDTLADVTVNEKDVRTVEGLTDFVKVDLSLANDEGAAVTLHADRCAGKDGAEARVLGHDDTVLAAYAMVDQDRQAQVHRLQADHPDWLGYLLAQAPEYKLLKETCAHAALENAAPAKPVATIQTAIDALKLAEHLTHRLLTTTDDDDDDVPQTTPTTAEAAPVVTPLNLGGGTPPIEVVS